MLQGRIGTSSQSASSLPTANIMAPPTADEIKYVCDIYDWDGTGKLDLFHLGDVVYALGLNITKKIIKGLGEQPEKGVKFAKFDEIVELVNKAVNTKDNQGTLHDYMELCKLYDKNENGTMMLAELENILANLGDEIPKEDVAILLKELADREDDEGFIPYKPFCENLVAGQKK